MKTSIKIKQMRKKILLGSIASLFAVATVFNMGLLNFNKHSDATLEAIAMMAEASGEGAVRDSTRNGTWKYCEILYEWICIGNGSAC